MTMRLKLFYWLLGKERHENHKFGSAEIGIVLNLKAQCREGEHVMLINGIPAIVPNSSLLAGWVRAGQAALSALKELK